MTVRVHYAPSPSGDPHLGITRVAVFNWLMARRHGGRFIIRIDDTDRRRLINGSVERILDGLRWLGLYWDEGPDIGGPHGPYVQSQRLGAYQEAVDRLLAAGQAYPCYCSCDPLEDETPRDSEHASARHASCRCRDLSSSMRLARASAHAVRFATPRDGITRVVDHVRGEIRTSNHLIEDFVLLRSDGFPTYHLANVVDDGLMGITHVIRSEWSLASTPKHVLLHMALGSKPPVFAHLAALLGPDGTVLSARHGAPGLLELREHGYLADALLEYLALFSPAGRDEGPASRDALIASFTLDKLPSAPARLDPNRLARTNGAHIRATSLNDLAAMLIPHLERDLPADVARPLDVEYVRAIVPLLRDRLRLLSDVSDFAGFFFVAPLAYDDALLAGDLSVDDARAALDASAEVLEAVDEFSAEAIGTALRYQASALAYPARSFFHSLRVALTGRAAAPPLFESIAVSGRARSVARLRTAAQSLKRRSAARSGGNP